MKEQRDPERDHFARQALKLRVTRRSLLVGLGALGGTALGAAGVPRAVKAVRETPALPVAAYAADSAISWFVLALDLIRTTPGFSPPVAARACGYLGLTLYEALVPGMPGYQSLAGTFADLPRLPVPSDRGYHWPAVATSALAAMARHLFPTTPSANQAAIDVLEQTLLSQVVSRVPPGVYRRSVERGVRVADHLFGWSQTDGGHEGYLSNFPADYTPPAGPGLWAPTPPGFLPALQPYWGQHRACVVTAATESDPGSPVTFSADLASPFFAEAYEVYDTVNHLSPEQLAIARFWSDDPGATSTPPGHSMSILNQVLVQQQASLDLAAEAYARVGIAVADAFICCWQIKYRYNLLRPITYIRQFIAPGWGDPLPLVTPPFPEYTSGHSVQAGAAAQVLTDLFGVLAFTDHTHDAHGLAPRSFPSFLAAAEEAAISRLYGGIHYRSAIERGLVQGQRIGQLVSALPLRR